MNARFFDFAKQNQKNGHSFKTFFAVQAANGLVTQPVAKKGGSSQRNNPVGGLERA
jgi:hypothetical protein